MNVSGITGLVFLMLLVGAAIVSQLALFVNVPSAIVCVGGTAALGIMSYGMRDFFRGVWALRVLLVKIPPETVSWRQVAVLRRLIALASEPAATTGLEQLALNLLRGLGGGADTTPGNHKNTQVYFDEAIAVKGA